MIQNLQLRSNISHSDIRNIIFINGNFYYTSQVVEDSLIAVIGGCDSIVTTNLIVNNSNFNVVDTTFQNQVSH